MGVWWLLLLLLLHRPVAAFWFWKAIYIDIASYVRRKYFYGLCSCIRSLAVYRLSEIR